MSITFRIDRVSALAAGLTIGAGIGVGIGAGAGLAHADTGGPGASSPRPPHTAQHRSPAAATHARTALPRLARRATSPAAQTLSERSSVESAAAGAAAASPPSLDQIVRYTLFNKAPTINPVQLSVDPETRLVTGDLRAGGPAGSTLTFALNRPPSKGAVTVGPGGTYTFTPNTELATNGGTDEFMVTVDDGSAYRLTGILGTIQAMLHSVAQAIGVSGPDTSTVIVKISISSGSPPDDPLPNDGELSTFCGCTLMPANTIFHADVSDLPVLAESDSWLDVLGAGRGATLRAGWGGQPWMGSVGGMPVNTVSATHPTEVVIFNRGYSTSGPGIDNSPYAIPDYPIVEGMPDVPAWDRHLLVFQEGTCISQELYNVANGVELPAAGILDGLGNAVYAGLYGSAWIAEAGVHYDMSSPLYPAIGNANASWLPYLPLILRPDELANGSIDHMLGIVIAKDHGTGHTWPARAGDGEGTNPNGVPMGTVFRLRADFDISGYAPATQVVLRALQEHGAVVYDSMGPGIDGAGLLAMSNGWTGTEYITAEQELSGLPISAFEAVDVSGIAVNSNIGWEIVGTS